MSSKPHTRAGKRTDLSSDGPVPETMADPQAAPPSESTDHKPEPEPAAGEDATPQSNAEEGTEIITRKAVGCTWVRRVYCFSRFERGYKRAEA